MNTRNVPQRGVALVLVLTMLVLLSALVVAFMTSATNERTSTVSSSSAAASRQIADTTVNLVMSQIREATTQSIGGSQGKVPKDTAPWSSQPGAIRTFTGKAIEQKANGALGAWWPTYAPGSSDTVFKLYSSDRMRVSAQDYEGRDLPEEVLTIGNWDMDEPAKDHVDLNQPILVQTGQGDNIVEPRYPIIDPRARYDSTGQPVSSSAPGIVEGFDMKGGIEDRNLLLAESGAKVPYLPLPVKWLYLLADGSMGAASRATAQNPIVGRTAFWVDDESSKLNINTASEGTFWDTPTASSLQESGKASQSKVLESAPTSLFLAAAQPARGEYQRYPGHPATTSLSPVLGWLAGLTPLTGSAATPPLTATKDFKEMIYKLSPFIPNGRPTSMGGTFNPGQDLKEDSIKSPDLKFNTKHLYATVDELIFNPERTRGSENPVPQLNEIAAKPTAESRLTPQAMEKMRFFLTASSRAPELNLFGRPRMTIWPIHTDLVRRTSFDDLFAFTSTIGDKKNGFYFTRSDAKDTQFDFKGNETMYKYLQAMTGDTQSDIPGFGKNFGGPSGKYSGRGDTGGTERDQILTMMLDYMRTVNLVDTGTSKRALGNTAFYPYTPKYADIDTGYNVDIRPYEWSGQVTPLQVGNGGQVTSMGLGRFLTVSEAALIFYRKGKAVKPQGNPRVQQPPEMEAVLALEMTTPMPGFPALKETYFTVVRAVRETKITVGPTQDVDIGFSKEKMMNIVNVPAHEVAYGRAFMPTLGFASQMHYFPDHRGPTNPSIKPDPMRNEAKNIIPKKFIRHPNNEFGKYKRGPVTSGPNDDSTVSNYPYVSNPIPVGTEKTFSFKGGSFEVEIWSGEGPTPSGDPRAKLVQTIMLNFPEESQTLPVPEIPDSYLQANNNKEYSFQRRLTGGEQDPWNFFDRAQQLDVVRSIEYVGAAGTQSFSKQGNKGDFRLGAVRHIVPAEFYEPRKNYKNSALRLVHGLQASRGNPLTTDVPQDSRFAPGGAFRGEKPPILPNGVNGVVRSDGGPGDWDRGLSKHMSGSFGNKVDEGNTNFDTTRSEPHLRLPYFLGRGIEETGQSYFSPNRQIASAVMFGSLPSGAARGLPWQTLLFRPDRERAPGHPGMKLPQDHLFLDLFNMPVVEPYAISEPFSTAGKVNLNFVIAPFGYAKGGGGNNQDAKNPRSYLRRDTALRGVMKAVKMMAIKTTEPEGGHRENPHEVTYPFRFDIDLNRTLEQFEDRFKDPSRGLFRSASEICEMDLFPRGLAIGSSWDAFWTQYGLTGDNMRERPYAHIYPRVTTRSNVYTVHMRCQVVKKAPNTPAGDFVEGRDQVLGEYRGSTTIERYVDPNDPDLKNYDATMATSQSAEPYYRFRVVNSKQFTAR